MIDLPLSLTHTYDYISAVILLHLTIKKWDSEVYF